ncbi:MAG: hypothetical protein KGJ46_09340, partial [Xanthomonadaceae bacterium]|nr:hypothetical protein [Xanthomonadaceae bacterium]
MEGAGRVSSPHEGQNGLQSRHPWPQTPWPDFSQQPFRGECPSVPDERLKLEPSWKARVGDHFDRPDM